jgi:cytoskeleton protein RodZ
MNEADSDSPKAGAGAQLTAGREQVGWSLVQAADRLHLDVAAVKALEAGQFDALGGAVYARGHLRRYAELLGLPVSEVEAAYTQANPPKRLPDPKRRVSLFANSAASAVGPWTIAVGAVIVVIVALIWWAVHMPHGSRAARATAGIAGAAPSTGTDAAAPGAGQPAAPPAAATQTVAANLSTPAESAPKVDLGLKFRHGSWAEIYDAAGTRLFSDFGSAGTERRLNGTAPLSILLGNASAVSLELDGRPVALGASATGATALRFSLDGGGHLFDVQAQRTPAHARGRP